MKKIGFLLLMNLVSNSIQAQYYKRYKGNELDCRVRKNTWEIKNSVGLTVATPWRQLYNVMDNTGVGVFAHSRLVLNKWLGVGLKGEVVKMRSFESNLQNSPNYNGITSSSVQQIIPGPIGSLSLTLDISPRIRKMPVILTGGLGAGYYYLADGKANFAGIEQTIPVGSAFGANAYGVLSYKKFSLHAGVHFIREKGKPVANIDYATLGMGYLLNRTKKRFKSRLKY